MKYLQTIQLILSLVPMLIKAITAIEEVIPGQGEGEKKLAAIKEIIQAAYNVADDVLVDFATFWPTIAQTVGALVGLFNTTGKFKTNTL